MRILSLALVLALLGGCASDQESYCEAVEEHQERLTEIAASDDASRAFDVLPVYQDLREQSPDDIRRDWDTVIGALEGLQQALDDAGVDASYDSEDPPAGLGAADRRAIERAAGNLGSGETLDAMSSVEQHALDVCKTPLSR